MGWSSGSTLFNNIIEALIDADIDDDSRENVYRAIIPCFEDMDCDTLMECLGEDKVFDFVYKELNKEYFDDYEEDWEEQDEVGC